MTCSPRPIQAFHASNELRDIYEEAESKFKATKIKVPARFEKARPRNSRQAR